MKITWMRNVGGVIYRCFLVQRDAQKDHMWKTGQEGSS